MRKVLTTTAAVTAAVVFFVLATLPRAPLAVDVSAADPALAARTMAGVYHIHTTRSDGAEDKASVARAARRAGLQFAIFTDHGDGTRPPDAPAYIDGVLCIDGVEISTTGGHYVALGMAAAPYPLGGAPAAVVEDVARLGGFGIAAHPDSPKPELAWADPHAPVDGIEWLSIDSEWRDESTIRLARALAAYAVRPAPAIASILDRPAATLRRWESLLRERHVVALAATDAHGGVRPRVEGGLPVGARLSYEAMFRVLSNRVVLDAPPSGDARADAAALLDAIRRGRVYTVVDALATPALVDVDRPDALRMVSVETGQHPLLPAGAVVEARGSRETRYYEVHLPAAPGTPPVPWLLTNPPAAARVPRSVEKPAPLPGGEAIRAGWRIEKDPTSAGRLAGAPDGRVTVEYRLGDGPRASQFVALAADLSQPGGRQIVFEGRAAAPMRLSVQLRFGGDDERWVASVYLDAQPRPVVVPLDRMTPAAGIGRMPDPAAARSLLFVVDLTNAAPGSSGEFSIADVRLAGGR